MARSTAEVTARLTREGLNPRWTILSPPNEFRNLVDDSRMAGKGDLFCAVPGTKSDGHDFVRAAAAAGALAAVVERPVEPDVLAQLVVRDSRLAVAHLAALFAGDPQTRVKLAGVTGTNGKSTTVWLARQVLSGAGATAAIGTLGVTGPRGELRGGDLTTPGPLDLASILAGLGDEGVEMAVMEVSSHALDQRRAAALSFEVGVFASFSREHLEYHSGIEEYRFAKLRLADLVAPSGTCATDAGESAWDGLPVPPGARLLRFGLESHADVRAESVCTDPAGSTFTLAFDGQSAEVRLALPAEFNIRNALAAACIGIGMGVDLDHIAERLSRAAGPPGRMEVLAGSPASVIRDFAHNPDSWRRVLRNLGESTEGRLIALGGCGGDRDRGKRRPMGKALAELADVAIVTGDNPRSESPEAICAEMTAGLAADTFTIIPDRREAIRHALELARPADTVVLLGKGHETTQTVAGETLPFDEAEIVRELVGARLAAHRVLTTRGIRRALDLDGSGSGTAAGNEAADPDLHYTEVSTDTRTIAPGALFVALKGERFDGTRFLGAAAAAGAIGAVVPRGGADPALPLQYFVVSDTLRALGDLAAAVRRATRSATPPISVAAVTGSSGKTTVKEMLACALSTTRPVHRTAGNFNNWIGLPLSVLSAPSEAEAWVLEAGASVPGEIARLTEIADPDVAVVTTIGPAHLEELGSLEGVLREKLSLASELSGSGLLLVGEEPDMLPKAARAMRAGVIVAGIGPDCDFHPDKCGAGAETVWFEKSGVRVELNVGGIHHLRDALIAAAAAEAMGASPAEWSAGLRSYRPVGLRGLVRRIGGLVVMADCYNANPQSFAAAIDHVASLEPGRRRAAFAGSMLELGQISETAHNQIAARLGEEGFNPVAATGLFSRAEFPAPAPRLLRADDAADVIGEFVNALAGNEVVLVKGSRGVRLERVIEALEQRFGESRSDAEGNPGSGAQAGPGRRELRAEGED